MAKYCASCKQLCEDDGIHFCPSCGSAQFIPVAKPNPQPAPAARQQPDPGTVPQPTPATAPQPTPAPVWQSTTPPPANNGYQAPVMPPVNSDFAQKPKKKSGVKKIIFAVIALCLVVAIVLNFSTLRGLFKRNFGSPESYYSFVEKKAVSEFCDTFEEYYKGYLFNDILNDSKHTVKMDLDFSDELLESFAADTGASMDLGWMNHVSLDLTVNSVGSALAADIGLGIDKQDVLTAVLFSDTKNNEFFLKLKEISDDVLKLSGDRNPLSTSDEFDREFLSKMLPKSDTVTKLITKYHGILFKNIGKVKKTKEDAKIDGLSQKLTVLTWKLTQKDVKKISLAVLKEMKDDKEIKSIFENAQGAFGGEDMYSFFTTGIDEAITEKNAEKATDETVVVVRDYINSKDEIVGRKIGENGEYLDYLTVQSGKKYAKIFRTQNGYSLKETGTKKGNRVTSECVITRDDETLYKINFTDFDKKASKKGTLDGKIKIVPNSSIVKDATPRAYQKYAGLFDTAFELDIKGNADKGNFKLTLLNGEKSLLKAKATYAVSSTKNAAKPGGKVIEIKGLDSLTEYMADMDLDQLIKNLRKTSVPKEYVDALENASKQLKQAR